MVQTPVKDVLMSNDFVNNPRLRLPWTQCGEPCLYAMLRHISTGLPHNATLAGKK